MRRISRIWPVCFCLFALAACGERLPLFDKKPAVPQIKRLQPPFDLPVRPARGKTATVSADFACPPPPPPVSLDFEGFYKPGTGSSEIDPEAMRRYRMASEPIVRYENAVTQLSDDYLRSGRRNAAIAQCVLTWLHRWAQSGAMLSATTPQGGFVRKWGLSPISASLFKIQGEPTLDAGQRATVRDWIARWAQIIRADYDTDTKRESRRNNHLYWAALGVLWAGVALDDRSFFRWSLGKYRQALRQIQPDGTLPLEMKRRSKARHYHLFALTPLVFIAETATRNGVDLYAADSNRLRLLIDRVLESLDNPSYFETQTGAKQQWVGEFGGGKLTWMEPYFARFADPRLKTWLARNSPMKNRRTGGDATLHYANTAKQGGTGQIPKKSR